MATMRKMKGNKYFSRITWRSDGKKKEITIPLQTISKTTARTRLKIVGNQEQDIIDGIIEKHQFKGLFSWLNDEGTSKYKSLTLEDIIPEYLKYRKCVVREGSVERDNHSLKQLTKVLGDSKVVQDLNYKDIEQKFIPYYQNKEYANSGINITLRHLKIFFNYLLKEKLIKEKIVFKMLSVDTTPCYITRAEINAINEIVDERFQRWFYFYEMVGCRAKDVFKGYIEGNVWKITPEEAKTKHYHYYQLTDELKYILMELQDLKQSYIDAGKTEKQAIKTAYQLIQKNLWRAVDRLKWSGVIPKDKKVTLKSFRHTFGIVNVVKTKDIWGTSKKMNHKEIGVTQQYLDIDHYIIGQDFPELKPYLVDNDSDLQGIATPTSDNALSPLTPSKSAKIGYGGNHLVETHIKKRLDS